MEFLSLKGGCRGSFESTHVKISHCWEITCHGSNVTIKDVFVTAYDDLADLLIQNGAKLNAQMHNGNTALMLACEHVSYLTI